MFWLLLRIYRMRSLTKLKYLVSGYLLSEMNKKVIGLLLFADVFVYLSGKIYEGFNLHTMWGLYADKGFGACLVFDKNKLKLAEGDYARDVEYMDYVLPDYAFRNKSKKGLKSEIWRNRDEKFFCKRKEWEYEQEYRVIRRAKHELDDEYLDVSDALSFVILCRDESLFDGESIWEGSHYMDIKSIDRKLPVLSYEFGLDWYELWRDVPDDPIWTEMSGFYI